MREDNETDFGFGEGNESDFTPSEDEDSDGAADSANDKPLVMRNAKRGSVERNIVTRGEKRRANEEKQSESSSRSSTESVEKTVGAVFNWDEYFKDEALFVVDAKQKGNLGR